MNVDSNLAEVPVNILPLLDDTDFKSREESVAYNATGLELIWHFTTCAGATTATVVTPTTGGNYDWAHQDGGMYTIEIPASGGASINNDTEGFGWFTGKATGVLPWRGPVIGFRAAGLNNALIDSAYSTTRGLAGTALPDAAADAAGGLPISDAGGLDLDAQIGTDIDAILVDTGTTLQGELDGIQADTEDLQTQIGVAGAGLTAVPWNAAWDAEVQSEAADALTAYDPPTKAELDSAVAPLATAAALATVDGIVDAILVDTGTTLDTLIKDVPTVAEFEARTLPSADYTVVSDLGTVQTGDAYARLGAPAGASVSADIAAVKAQTAAIEADTQDLQTQVGTDGAGLTAVPWNAAWDAEVQSEAADALTAYDPPTNAEMEARTLVAANYATAAALDAVDNYVDTEIGAIKAVTDKLDTALELDGAVYRYTANALEEGPSSSGLDAAGVRAAVGLAEANLDTQLGTLATSAELATDAEIATATAALILATPANKLTTDASGRVEVSGTKNTLDDLNDAAPAPSAADIKTALEADGSKLDHLWEMTEDDGGVRRLTANALEEAPVDGAAPTVGDIADAVWDEALAGHAGAGTAGAALSAATAPTAADVADAVWDEALAGHLGAGTTGAALNAAGAAGDPWTTALPGAYADGTAGDIIGNLVTDIGALTPAVAISATTAASVSTGALAVRTYHSLSQAISSTYAGNLNAATKLWLAAKAEKDDTDAQAVIFIEKTAGLTVLAGAAYTTVAHGSLTIGGLAGAWTVTVALDEVATGLLTPYADGMLWAECKALVAGSTVAVWDGVCDIARGIVNAVS